MQIPSDDPIIAIQSSSENGVKNWNMLNFSVGFVIRILTPVLMTPRLKSMTDFLCDVMEMAPIPRVAF